MRNGSSPVLTIPDNKRRNQRKVAEESKTGGLPRIILEEVLRNKDSCGSGNQPQEGKGFYREYSVEGMLNNLMRNQRARRREA
jgi:hypothetical protein